MLSLLLLMHPDQSQAQWPPFDFGLRPTYEQGQITYNLRFTIAPEYIGNMTNVRINIPLPEGTRFVEGRTAEITTVSFDGQEVRFFTANLPDRSIPGMSFVVEVTDPAKEVISAQAWIAWEGEMAGDFLADKVEINIANPALNWESPATARLGLEVAAEVEGETITYAIYPYNRRGRMWDLRVSFPIPAGATFVSAEAPDAYSIQQTDQQVLFSTLELVRRVSLPPLKVKVSTAGQAVPLLQTRVEAIWKNVGRNVGVTLPLEESTETGDILVQPGSGQRVVADQIGDVPLGNYDLTTIAFQEVLLPGSQETALKIILYTADQVGIAKQARSYYVYIDQDCSSTTGQLRSYLGADYMIRYQHHNGKGVIREWQGGAEGWSDIAPLPVEAPAAGRRITLWVPARFLLNTAEFCWRAQARAALDTTPGPPGEVLPKEANINLYWYRRTAQPLKTEPHLPAVE